MYDDYLWSVEFTFQHMFDVEYLHFNFNFMSQKFPDFSKV